MINRANQKCVPCEGDYPPLTKEQAEKELTQLNGWKLDGETQIEKKFTFKDFKEAMQFVNKVADIAESEGHHPDIEIKYNKVGIELTTHAIKGLSVNDFILAAKIDTISVKDRP